MNTQSIILSALNPYIFQYGFLQIRWYGVLIGLGIFVAYLIGNREANKQGLPKELISDILIWAVPIAIIGARMYYVLFFNFDYYIKHPGEILQIWQGGLAIHGGLIAAILFGFFYLRYRKISFLQVADIAAPGIIIAQAIGRWGNFMNQEAHGGAVTREYLESLYLPDFIINQMYINGTYYHPTFLYESLWSVLGFIFIIVLRKFLKDPKWTGFLFATYLIWYSVGRFFIEGLRTDSLLVFETIRVAQLVSVMWILLVVFIIIYVRFLAPKINKVKKNKKR